MPPDIVLYGFPGSLCSQKVRLALAEKSLVYDNRFIDIELKLTNFEPWYLKLNSKGVVPTLVHGDQVVTNSVRILEYIDEAFQGPSLTPEDPAERERMAFWVGEQDRVRMRELSYANFQGALGLILRRISMPLRVRKLHRLRNENQSLAALYDAKIEDVRQWRAEIRDKTQIEKFRLELEDILRQLEEQLGKTSYLAANTYSLADVTWTCVLARLKMLGLASTFWGDGRLPRVETYYDEQRARPGFMDARIWEAPPNLKTGADLLRSAFSRG